METDRLRADLPLLQVQMQVRAAQPDGDEGGGDPRDLGHRAARRLHGVPLLPRAHARQGIAPHTFSHGNYQINI